MPCRASGAWLSNLTVEGERSNQRSDSSSGQQPGASGPLRCRIICSRTSAGEGEWGVAGREAAPTPPRASGLVYTRTSDTDEGARPDATVLVYPQLMRVKR